MGFDLCAKKDQGYFRAGLEGMITLRAGMVAAGVDKLLVYKKFVSNDGLLVTPLQSQRIAEKLKTWLSGRNLVLDLAEGGESAAQEANAPYAAVFMALGDQEARRVAKRIEKPRPTLSSVDRQTRKMFREFADFCSQSGGFRVS